MIVVNSMSDLFHKEIPKSYLQRRTAFRKHLIRVVSNTEEMPVGRFHRPRGRIQLTERPMRRSKPQVRRGQKHKSPPALVLSRSREASKANSPPLPPDFVFLANAHDQLAVTKLRSAVGELAVDVLIRNHRQLIRQFREALVEVYLKAAQTRELRKATKRQIEHARSAEKYLTLAIRHLEALGTDGRDDLSRLLAGPPLDDAKGERERNHFEATTQAIRLDIAGIRQALQSAINAEVKKSTKSGERSKRLRTLIEALASWWLLGGGRSISPYVKANRRDDGPAVVHGRSGKFLELAVALFCGVDVFKKAEVEAAVTNVHEAQLKTKSRKGRSPQS
jgi:hypothetical protein